MRHFPAFMDLQDRPAALFGSGAAALGKARLLLKAGAHVHVFAESLEGELARLAGTGAIRHERRAAGDVDISRFCLVVSCAGDPTDAAVAARARALNIPVNVVDRADLCTFITPSIVDRGEVVVAVSTGGDSPVIARRLRARIEALVPAGIGALARLVGRNRPRVAAKLAAMAERRNFWERIVDGPVGAAAVDGDGRQAEALLEAEIARLPAGGREGVLHIVGAGPGDPELLTLKALRVLQDADVIFHDDLVPPEILDLARRDAERVFVGKRADRPGMPQAEIIRRLIAEARRGARVARLKGGDPFVFGRGGEEAEAARAAGVTVHVVPGVTAALGLAAEAQIPLTHRDEAASLTIATGRRKAGGPSVDWARLPAEGTLAVYMGRREAGAIARGLIAAGRAPDTAVAIIANGTRPQRRSAVGRLSELPALTAQAGDGPTLLIIGDAVRRSALWGAAAETRPVAAE